MNDFQSIRHALVPKLKTCAEDLFVQYVKIHLAIYMLLEII